MTSRDAKYCIVGAGASGLTAARNLQREGIAFDVLERAPELGGLWNYSNPESSVYRSTHLLSSKPLTEFTDFPFPAEYPDYPHHSKVLRYFHAYAEAFGLHETIEFDTEVTGLEPAGTGWTVKLGTGGARDYAGVIIANGHLAEPKTPEYPGEFAGETLHSKQYKTPDVLAGKRVLVVGAGNSGCDIAVESAQNAAKTFHSVRRGYHYIPKYIMGKPVDQFGELALRLRIPLAVRRLLNGLVVSLVYGRPEDFGLPKPDHKLLESHPIVNSQIFYYLGHGDITPKPDIAVFAGDKVQFGDGSEEEVDLIIFATGYKISFPFIDRKYLNWSNGRPELFLNIFHPDFDNLFCAGLIQPDSGQWGLVDYQMQLVARFIALKKSKGTRLERFREIKAHTNHVRNGKIHYLKSERHLLEVEHFSYRKQLQKYIRMLAH